MKFLNTFTGTTREYYSDYILNSALRVSRTLNQTNTTCMQESQGISSIHKTKKLHQQKYNYNKYL